MQKQSWVALVTGGARGTGLAFAQKLAEANSGLYAWQKTAWASSRSAGRGYR